MHRGPRNHGRRDDVRSVWARALNAALQSTGGYEDGLVKELADSYVAANNSLR